MPKWSALRLVPLLGLLPLAASCSSSSSSSSASGGDGSAGASGTGAAGAGGAAAGGGASGASGSGAAGAAPGGKGGGAGKGGAPGAGGGGAPGAGGGTGGSGAGGSGAGGAGAGGPGGASGSGGSGGRDLSGDRSKFFGDSRCSGAGLLLCDDFESGSLDTGLWSVEGSAPVIDGGQKARGSKALHIHVKSTGGYVSSLIREKSTFPVANNRFYGRAFVYFQALPVAQGSFNYSHWTFIAASGTGTSGDIRVSGQMQNGVNHFGVGTDSGKDPAGTGDWTNSDDDPKGSPQPVPTGQWACIEWMNDGEHDETRFWWDAVEHPSLHTTAQQHGGNTNPYHLPQFTSAWVGWQVYQGGGEDYELWIDEVAIDKDRIGCVY